MVLLQGNSDIKIQTLVPVTYFESLRDFKSGTYARGNSALLFALFLAKLECRIIYDGDCAHCVQECWRNVDECRGLLYTCAWCRISDSLLAARAGSCSIDREAHQRLLSPTFVNSQYLQSTLYSIPMKIYQ